MHARTTISVLVAVVVAAIVVQPTYASVAEKPNEGPMLLARRFVSIVQRHALHAGKGAYSTDLLTREVVSGWTGAWENQSEYLYFYSGDRLVEIREQAWTTPSGPWARSGREVTVYSGDLVVEERSETWNGTTYVPDNRTRTSYGPGPGGSQLPTEDVYERWNGSGWDPEDRTLYTYSGSNIASLEDQVWNGTAWEPDGKTIYSQEGPDLVMTSDQWNGSEWVHEFRTVYPGKTMDDLIAAAESMAAEFYTGTLGGLWYLFWLDTVSYEWSGTEWVALNRTTGVRDGQNRVTVVNMEEFDGSAWVPSSRYVYTYGAGGRPSAVSFEMFDGSAWMVFSRDEYTYNAAGHMVTAIHSMISFLPPFALQPTNRYEYEWGSGSSTAVESSELPERASLVAAYPNPFNPGTVVSYRLAATGRVAISVFDGVGRKVATLVDGVQPAGENQVRFEAGLLPSGVYYVVMQASADRSVLPVALVR